MKTTLLFSMVLGCLWHGVVSALLGGLGQFLNPAGLLAGAFAGLVAGAFTVWSRRRRGGREHFGYGLATYYVGIVAYWTGLLVHVVEQSLRHGTLAGIDWADFAGVLVIFVLHGTVWYGLALIPLNFLTRAIVWRVHQWSVGRVPQPVP